MILKYTGLKPIINEHGISFKEGKEDKYIYLNLAIEILVAINHRYEKNHKYSHSLKDINLKESQMIGELKKLHPNIDSIVNKDLNLYLKHLEKEEQEVFNKKLLTTNEKDAYLNNLKLMKNYKIQRATNKIFYFHCIDTIVELIVKNKIKEIDTPFNEKFWHIIESVKNELTKKAISSKLETKKIDEELKAFLNINL